ncbi:MAG: amidohydrolase family protein [Gammaproteobacteria bacterium]|nr:amidohydrolase family protein [Gammaproteobacteria bacterium]
MQSFHGSFVHTPRRGELELLRDTRIDVTDGCIARISADPPDASCVTTGDNEYFLPGFVDLHVHAPQWPQLGNALHLPLEDWLWQCTFPLEARCADLDYAHAIYTALVRTLLRHGTTTAVYFGSIHVAATCELARLCAEHGQRAVVGKVVMDDPAANPGYYRDESTDAGLAGTQQLIEYVRDLPGELVLPAITPRFIPSCSDSMLQELGKLTAATGAHVQTHCSESDWEHSYVLDRLGKTDTTALDDFGLLTRRSVLAHANFIGADDMRRIGNRGAGIAHCPLSNAYFADSVFPLRAALDKSMHVGLGTDISGGPSASLFDNARHAISSSRILEHGADPSLPAARRGRKHSRIDFRDALWLASAGGAEVLDLPVGRFVEGNRFDAMLIDTARIDGGIYPDTGDDLDALVQKTIYGATPNNIRQVWTDAVARLH